MAGADTASRLPALGRPRAGAGSWAARLRARAAAVPRPLVALLVAATVLSVGWTVSTAWMQGPDEQGHVAYVQYLAETGDGPDVSVRGGRALSSEARALWHWANLEPVTALWLARPGWSDAEQNAWRRVQDSLPRDDGGGPNPLAQNPPLYYGYSAIAYRIGTGWSLPSRMLLMRLANIPLLWITIICAWVALGELFTRRFTQTVGTGAVALLPMLTFMSGVVNPDIALAAVGTAAITLGLVGLRVGPRPAVVLGLGALGAAALLVHGRGLGLAPPILLVIAYLLWRERREPGNGRRLLLGAGALGLVAAGFAAALVYSGAHAGSTSFGGELTGSSESGWRDLSGMLSYVWQFYLSPLTDMKPPPGEVVTGYRQVYVEQFLTGAFGSLEIRYGATVYRVMQVLQGVGLVVLLGAVVHRWPEVRARLPQALLLAVFLLGMLGMLHVAAWQDLSSPPHAALLAGRYLLPLVVVFAAALAFVVDSLPGRLRVGLGATVLAVGAVLCVGGVVMTMVRFYA